MFIKRPKTSSKIVLHTSFSSLNSPKNPSIYLLPPEIEENRPKPQTQQIIIPSLRDSNIANSFGMLSISDDWISSSFSSMRDSKLYMADLLGKQNIKKILCTKKLIPLKNQLKRKVFKEGLKVKSSLNRPTDPAMMDKNTELRLIFKRNKAEASDRRKCKKNTMCLSLSPVVNGNTSVRFFRHRDSKVQLI